MKRHATTEDTILNLLATRGPMFACELTAATGFSAATVWQITRRLVNWKDPIVKKRKVKIPKELRGDSKIINQYQFYRTDVGNPLPEPSAVTLAPMKPLKGCGIVGRPIVIRAGADWALQQPPIVETRSLVGR